MHNLRYFRCWALILCAALILIDVAPVNGQGTISGNPTNSGEAAAVYAGVAAAAGIVVVIIYLVLRKPSITGCVENGAGGLALRTQGENRSYSLTGETAQLKAGERVRVFGKANKKNRTFAVSKLSKDFGSCQVSGA